MATIPVPKEYGYVRVQTCVPGSGVMYRMTEGAISPYWSPDLYGVPLLTPRSCESWARQLLPVCSHFSMVFALLFCVLTPGYNPPTRTPQPNPLDRKSTRLNS